MKKSLELKDLWDKWSNNFQHLPDYSDRGGRFCESRAWRFVLSRFLETLKNVVTENSRWRYFA